jgi:anti-sigma factor RsiW
MTDTIETFSEREEIEMLLPWYTTGRLAPDEHARVARYLADHPDVARQLDLVGDELEATVAGNEALKPSRNLSVAATMATLPGATRSDASGVLQVIMSGLRDLFVVPSNGSIRWAGAAAALLIVAQAGIIGLWLTQERTGTYQTASGGNGQSADGAFALVRFTDTATTGEVSDLLSRLGMTIADGPKPGGLYRVRIGDATLTGDQRTARIVALKSARKTVMLATPAP